MNVHAEDAPLAEVDRETVYASVRTAIPTTQPTNQHMQQGADYAEDNT
jgi:hypothetical protein